MTLSFSTATVDDRSQLEYWREVVCATFVELEFEPPQRHAVRFRGEVTAEELGGMRVATVVSEPHTVARSPMMIRRSFADDFFVNLAVRGRLTVIQDGRVATLRPGDFTVYDSARPCRIAGLDPFELLVLKVPRPLFAAHCPLPLDATATAVRGDHGVGALLSPFLRSLTAQVSDLPPDAVSRVSAAMLELLATALADRIDASARPRAPRTAHMIRARRYIVDHLADPELSPATVAGALGMSVRYLHALFHAEDTSPFRWIIERRLEEAARRLADPREADRSVTNIAFGVGFKSAAHFTRTFKNRYGVVPRDYRRHHVVPERAGTPIT
jgi:AraC-like DNA-binding protein